MDGAPVALGSLKGIVRMLAHRGLDDTGFHAERGVGLAHPRLSIIDLACGHQPMCNEDSSLWITFNGEIFNYVELREELLKKGHSFSPALIPRSSSIFTRKKGKTASNI